MFNLGTTTLKTILLVDALFDRIQYNIVRAFHLLFTYIIGAEYILSIIKFNGKTCPTDYLPPQSVVQCQRYEAEYLGSTPHQWYTFHYYNIS